MLAAARNKIRRRKLFAPRSHRHKRHQFLVAWIRSPLKVGALMPSSRALARAMATPINCDHPGVVIELGAGTGVVTHALLEAGVSPEKLLVIERDAKLHAVLSAQFHDLNIVCADAAKLDDVLAEHNITRVNAIVSSLPLLSMPKQVRHAIEQCMMRVMGEKGIIVQFTYGPNSPLRREMLRPHRLEGRRVKMVLANIPPAHVWVYRHEKA